VSDGDLPDLAAVLDADTRRGESGGADRQRPAAGSSGPDPTVDASTGLIRAPTGPLADHVLDDALTYAREREYTGWDYGDGMSSRALQALPVDSRLLNLAVQEVVKRTPVNVRPLFLVEQRRNYMGASLFAMTNLTLDRLLDEGAGLPVDETVDYRREAHRLLTWLVDNRASGHSGFGLGHQHPIQDLQGLADANEPGAVCTSIAAKALLRGSDIDEGFADVAETAADFVVEDLEYRPTEEGARITYSNNHEGEYYTINAGALAGRLFVDLYDHVDTRAYRRRARQILDHIATLQEDAGGWMYRDPPTASHLSMDTHHNGFIIEAFQRYAAATGDDRYADVCSAALSFFETLFDDDGAPHFDEDTRYPRDIHACAQGILVFTYAGDVERAGRILEWTVENLYAGGGRFYFRKGRLVTHRVTLMRWCQAWMCFAMSEYLRAVCGERPIASV